MPRMDSSGYMDCNSSDEDDDGGGDDGGDNVSPRPPWMATNPSLKFNLFLYKTSNK